MVFFPTVNWLVYNNKEASLFMCWGRQILGRGEWNQTPEKEANGCRLRPLWGEKFLILSLRMGGWKILDLQFYRIPFGSNSIFCKKWVENKRQFVRVMGISIICHPQLINNEAFLIATCIAVNLKINSIFQKKHISITT